MGFSFLDRDFTPGKGDMIEGGPADLNGPEPEAIGQVDDGIIPDTRRSSKLQAGKELLYLKGPQEFGQFVMEINRWVYQQKGKVLADDLFFMV